MEAFEEQAADGITRVTADKIRDVGAGLSPRFGEGAAAGQEEEKKQ